MTRSDPLTALDATAQAALVRSGEATPAELVESAIERIDRLDSDLHAVIAERFDDARAEAARELPDGPFRGVPILVKDLGAGQVDGLPYHQGNRALKEAGFVSQGDSYVVQRLRRAGFVILGKTNTPELGFGVTTEPEVYPATRNPWDTARSAAGSSGGSGAAVASGMVPVATGSDGGGSIRMPASVNGLVGLKPSRGRVSKGPFIGDPGAGRSVEHALARSVRDTAAMLDVLAGAEPGDPHVAPPPSRNFASEVGADPGRLRIAVRTAPLVPGADPAADVVAAVEYAARLLESLGHRVEPGVPDALVSGDERAISIITLHAASVAASVVKIGRLVGREVGEADFEAATWEHVELGRTFSGPQVFAAREDVFAWSRAMCRWWEEGHDLFLTPTTGTPAAELGELVVSTGDPDGAQARVLRFAQYCPAANWIGAPAISLPLGTSTDGLPIGVQLTAAYGREDVLLRIAAQLEEAAPWTDRRPRLHA